jgi:hypothetical protein
VLKRPAFPKITTPSDHFHSFLHVSLLAFNNLEAIAKFERYLLSWPLASLNVNELRNDSNGNRKMYDGRGTAAIKRFDKSGDRAEESPKQPEMLGAQLTQLARSGQEAFLSAQGDLNGAVNALAKLNLNAQLALPRLVVCGDQSSGKSSVLEAITGIPFPRGSLATMRVKTEVRLMRHNSEAKVTVQIQPGPSRSLVEIQRLINFRQSFEDSSGLDQAAAKHS